MTTESKILRLVDVYGAFKATAARIVAVFFRLKIRHNRLSVYYKSKRRKRNTKTNLEAHSTQLSGNTFIQTDRDTYTYTHIHTYTEVMSFNVFAMNGWAVSSVFFLSY